MVSNGFKPVRIVGYCLMKVNGNSSVPSQISWIAGWRIAALVDGVKTRVPECCPNSNFSNGNLRLFAWKIINPDSS